jgi:hypothetical protein
MNLMLPFLIASLAFTAFWAFTLYRVLTDDSLDKTNKIIWVVAITVVPLIGCILYYVLPDRQIKI